MKVCFVTFHVTKMEFIFCSRNASYISVHETICRNYTDIEEILISKIGPKRRSLLITTTLLFIYLVIFMTGVIGNVITCIVICRTSYMRTSTNFYLFSLAISDVILLLVGLPPEAYSIWEAYPWRFGKAFCIIKALFGEMTSYASVLTITAFTIERYIAICKPLKSHKIVAFSRCIKIIIAIWIISLCCALPYPIHTDLFYYVKDDKGNPIKDSLQCNIPPNYYGRMTHVFQLSTFVFFVFPLTMIIVLYSLIGYTLRKAELSRESSDKRYKGSCRHSNSGLHDRSPTYIARRSVLKVLVAVVVAFFVCWAPFHAQRLLTVFNRHWTPLLFDVQSSLFYISGVLYFVGSTVNPILYNVMSRRYRLAFLETICHSRTNRSYSSYRNTNGGTSFKPKQSSLKTSLKWPLYGKKNDDNAKQPKEVSDCKFKACFDRHSECEDKNVELVNGTNKLYNTTNKTARPDGRARIRAYKGGFNPQEVIQAERKHATKCAQHEHVDYIHFQCTNLADIPPLCLGDEVSNDGDVGICNECKVCPECSNIAKSQSCTEDVNRAYLINVKTNGAHNHDNGKAVLIDHCGLHNNCIGAFV